MPSPPPTPRDEAAAALLRATHGVSGEPIPVHTDSEPCKPCQAGLDAVLAVLATHIQQLQRDEQRLARQMYPKENREAGVNHWGAARGIERVLALLRDTTPHQED